MQVNRTDLVLSMRADDLQDFYLWLAKMLTRIIVFGSSARFMLLFDVACGTDSEYSLYGHADDYMYP